MKTASNWCSGFIANQLKLKAARRVAGLRAGRKAYAEKMADPIYAAAERERHHRNYQKRKGVLTPMEDQP